MTMQKLTAADSATRSHDLVAKNIERLKALFPELLTEGPNGAALNVDVLKTLVGDNAVMNEEEKYGLNWHGKRRARQLALTPSTGTLRPCPEDSVDWNTTQNLMIEGDNLEVLKLMQKSYAGKVKLIYIDPPYNTGKDFVYPDNFKESITNYLVLTGQVDGGAKISSNTDASGRFHTDWLNMMLPRLVLAKNLLRNDGAIFITIDDTEVGTLKMLCSEVFGEENFVGCAVWQKSYSPANDKKGVDAVHDYVLIYQKSSNFAVRLLPRTAKQDDAYTNPDNDPRGPWKAVDATRAEHRDYAYYPIITPSGKEVLPARGRSWVFTKEELPKLLADNRLWFGRDGSSKPSRKLFLTEVKQGLVPTTWWSHEDAGHNDEAKKELKSLFPEDLPFQTPKPTRLIQRIATIATNPLENDIVVDFFAGSGTTGQAVSMMNVMDGGNRRCILVQLPEETGNSAFPTIAHVTSERLRRAGRRIMADNPTYSGDLGFRVFKLDTSNIRSWAPDPSNLDGTLLDAVEHLQSGRTESDVLFELLLKLGLDLCVAIESWAVRGHTIYSVGGGVLMSCLSEQIRREDVEDLAQAMVEWREVLAPAGDTTCVFRDSAFADDVTKTNMAAILEQHGIANVRSL
jgi:adenine-specific DNA-methyltransferase